MLETLKKFCGDDPGRRYLMVPFSCGDFVYATNGHIMVRVPMIDGVAPLDLDRPLKLDAPLEPIDKGSVHFTPLRVTLPSAPVDTGVCKACNGRGYMAGMCNLECDRCTCTCTVCDGTGDLDVEARTSTTVRGVLFVLGYVRLMLTLPNVRVHVEPGGLPLLFSFEGGFGALMPLRRAFDLHVDIESAQ